MVLLAAVMAMQSVTTFEVQGRDFMLNGQPFVVRSGEMHYPRIPRPYWRHRMKMAKAMGLNTICTYVFWNLHEAHEGRFDFSDNLDLGEFLKTAKEEGLYAIVRPGPYVCSELDFGGFPAWLYKYPAMKVRSTDPRFLRASERYLERVGREVKPHLAKNGGNVFMVQVENEYGSYGSDSEYMGRICDSMMRNFDALLFTSDGPVQKNLSAGSIPEITATINFNTDPESAFKELEKFRPGSPRMIGEYWSGWFDHWGKPHHRTKVAEHVKHLEWCLANDVSFNLYMFHGGTNWGFMQGSNGSETEFQVDTTSYDYDSPVDEAGRATEKFFAFREAITKATGQTPPDPPAPILVTEVPPFQLRETADLFANLPKPIPTQQPKTFEELGQAHGLLLYRAKTPLEGKQELRIGKLHDYATVFVNGGRVGVLDRRLQQKSMELDLPPGGSEISVLVESLSRINFGSMIPGERKGILGEVRLGGKPLLEWRHYKLPLNHLKNLAFKVGSGAGPRFFRGEFSIDDPADTFFDMRDWNKGFLWVNGRNLGRFWRIGPQQTLYVPGVWLRKGRNEVVVYDEGPAISEPVIQGLREPILDQLQPAR
jgi:beta-galactosidase